MSMHCHGPTSPSRKFSKINPHFPRAPGPPSICVRVVVSACALLASNPSAPPLLSACILLASIPPYH